MQLLRKSIDLQGTFDAKIKYLKNDAIWVMTYQ